MSKSLDNYIGITETPKNMFGKIMSASDELMLRFYELLSHISIDELNELKEGMKDGSVHPMDAKKALGVELVDRYHGKGAGLKAKEEFENIFRKKGLPDEIPEIRLKDNKDIWLPRLMKESDLINVSSSGEAIRLIKQGGVSVDGEKWTDPDKNVPAGEHDLKVGKRGLSVDGEKWTDPDKNVPAGEHLLKVGKRRFLKILPE
jgi:tyrosyl-tRNA synthetase